jgi:RNA polymerase sigma-70 factor (ECF subfamily)
VDEANDVLQDVFISVHRSLASYQPEKGALSTWLYRVTVNNCLSWKRKKRLFLLSFDEAGGNAADSRALRDSHAHEEEAEAADQVLKALRHLSAKLRVVVVLRYYRDLSYAEIAVILNIPIGTVKSRLGQAIVTLRSRLAADMADSISTNLLRQEASL